MEPMKGLKSGLGKWKTGLSSGEIYGIAVAITLSVIVVLAAYIWVAQTYFRQTDLKTIIVEGLTFEFLGVGLLMLIIPTATELVRESKSSRQPPNPNASKTSDDSSDHGFWKRRMQTVVAVAVTIILLIFTAAWAASPERLTVQNTTVTSTTGANATTNVTNSSVTLNPFVSAYFDAFKIVIIFYFGAAGVQAIADAAVERKKEPTPPQVPSPPANPPTAASPPKV